MSGVPVRACWHGCSARASCGTQARQNMSCVSNDERYRGIEGILHIRAYPSISEHIRAENINHSTYPSITENINEILHGSARHLAEPLVRQGLERHLPHPRSPVSFHCERTQARTYTQTHTQVRATHTRTQPFARSLHSDDPQALGVVSAAAHHQAVSPARLCVHVCMRARALSASKATSTEQARHIWLVAARHGHRYYGMSRALAAAGRQVVKRRHI